MSLWNQLKNKPAAGDGVNGPPAAAPAATEAPTNGAPPAFNFGKPAAAPEAPAEAPPAGADTTPEAPVETPAGASPEAPAKKKTGGRRATTIKLDHVAMIFDELGQTFTRIAQQLSQ